jgi:fructokinase
MTTRATNDKVKRVTSVGEILFDVYPGYKTLGGAPFNFLYHVKKLTGLGNFISRIGDDKEGKEIIRFLKTNDIPTEYVQIDPEHPTGESIANLNRLKIPSWEIKTGTAYDFIELSDDIKALIANKTDCLYFGTLAQRDVVTRNTVQNFFNMGLIYFCDLNIRQNFYTENLVRECISVSDVLKLNVDELRLVNEMILKKNFDTYETPERLLNKYPIKLLCITYGDQGAVIFKEDKHNHFKVTIDNVVDTVGAGDAYAAILCIGYLRKWDIEKINRIASEFAGEIVKINGALPADSVLYDKYKRIVNE